MEEYPELPAPKKQFPWVGFALVGIVLALGFFVYQNTNSAKKAPVASMSSTEKVGTNTTQTDPNAMSPDKLISGIPPYMSPNPKSPKNPVEHTGGNVENGYFGITVPYDWQTTTMNFAANKSTSMILQKTNYKMEISKTTGKNLTINFDASTVTSPTGQTAQISDFEEIAGVGKKYRRIMTTSATTEIPKDFIAQEKSGSWTNQTDFGYIVYTLPQEVPVGITKEMNTIVGSIKTKEVSPPAQIPENSVN